MIAKALAGAAIAVGAAVGVAAPAVADPNPFGDLTCGCVMDKAGSVVPSQDQMSQAILQGLTRLQTTQAQQ